MLNGHLSGKELFIRFTASAFCKLLSIYVFSCFPFGFEGRVWGLIVSVPDHCLSFYFDVTYNPFARCFMDYLFLSKSLLSLLQLGPVTPGTALPYAYNEEVSVQVCKQGLMCIN